GWSDLFYLWMYRTVRRMLPIRPRIKFDPPDPPDGGMGGGVSRITATVNQLSSSLRARYAHMWADLDAQTEAGLTGRLGRFGAFAPQFEAPWTGMIDNLLARIRSTTPVMQSEWQAIADSVRSPQPTLTTTRVAWDVTLRDMLTRLGIHVPQFELGWRRISDAVKSVLGPLTEARLSWAESLQSMYSSAVQYVSGIVSSVQEAITALRGLRQESQTPSQAQPPIIP